MISITEDGLVVISRVDYLYRDGELNKEDYNRMGDGDIPIGRISEEAWKDKKDAKEIIDYINEQLDPETSSG